MVKHRFGGFVTIDSAGTHRYHVGELPDRRARLEGSRRGYVLDHGARQVYDGDFDAFDLIVAMDDGHVGELHRRAGRSRRTDHIVLLRQWDPERSGTDAPIPGVADPYAGTAQDFVEMFDVIERCCDRLCADLGDRLSASS